MPCGDNTMLRIFFSSVIILLFATSVFAIDLESFEFSDADDTPLTSAVNTANPGNFWFYDEEATTPGDETTGDTSTVQSGNYQIITDSAFATGLDSRYLDIANVSSGTIYLSATFSDWNFSAYDGSTAEQVRFTFLDDDTGTSGSTVTAQMQIRRNTTTGSMELFGDAIGTSGSFDIANTVDLPDTQTGPFTMVLAVDEDSDSFEVFYKDGANPSQSLGLGGISRSRDVNSIRMVTNNFGVENFLPFVITEEANLDRVVVSDTNPLSDLITLEVDRVTGAMTLVNTSGASVSGITSVSLGSGTGSIDLSEFDDFSGTLSDSQSVSLDLAPGSSPGVWIQSPIEDVSAELVIAGGNRTVDVNFVGNGGIKWVTGDLDFDGTLDGDDFLILMANAESDLSSLSQAAAYQLGDLDGDGENGVADFGIFKSAYIAENGASAFAAIVAVSVPEPGTMGMTILALITFGTARRRNKLHTTTVQMSNTMTNYQETLKVFAAAMLLTLCGLNTANAIVFEDYNFDDTAGTLITGAVNSINPTVFFDEDTDTIDVMTNGLGQLDASLKNNTGFGTNYVDVEPEITSGIVYGVMELTWDFQSVLDTSENEEIRISLTNNDPRGTEITAEFRIVRNDSDQIVINGQAGGTGSTDLPDTILNGGSLTQSDKFIAVVAADLDDSTYEILYSNNAGSSFLSAGTGVSSTDRIVEAMRMTLNNDLSNDNVLVDRVYLTDTLPFVIDPDKLTLQIDPVTGQAAIINSTTSTFDIDYYRILSDDDSLIESNWNSLEEQAFDAVDGPDGGSVVGDGIGETWTEAGGSDDGVLSESFLLSSSVFDESDFASLGNIFDIAGDDQLLTFEYRDAVSGNVFEGEILLATLDLGLPGDFNLDGTVDAADYTVFRDNLGLSDAALNGNGTGSGTVSPADYDLWVANYGSSSSSANSTSVPEPSSLVLIAMLTLVGCSTKKRHPFKA